MTKNQTIIVSILIGIGLAIIAYLVFLNPVFATQNDNVTICHKNNGNGWSKISVDPSSINGQGNGDHNSSQHQNGQDIIPSGYWDYNGRNWDSTGQAIWNNDCNVPVSPTPSPSPTITPTPTDIPEEPEYCTDEEALNYKEEGECEYEEEPTPTPTPTEQLRTESSSSVTTPVCTDGNTQKVVANLHVVRNGSSADINFFITEGNSANIYWRLNSEGNWTHALSNVKPNSENYVSVTINDLQPTGDYTFGVQQVNGCGGGNMTTAVVIDDYLPNIFRVNYYE